MYGVRTRMYGGGRRHFFFFAINVQFKNASENMSTSKNKNVSASDVSLPDIRMTRSTSALNNVVHAMAQNKCLVNSRWHSDVITNVKFEATPTSAPTDAPVSTDVPNVLAPPN